MNGVIVCVRVFLCVSEREIERKKEIRNKEGERGKECGER